MIPSDLKNRLTVAKAKAITATTDNTAVVSSIVDLQGYDGVLFAILSGSLVDADATFTLLVEEGEAANLSDAAAVSDDDLIGTEALASFIFSEDDTVKTIGYCGTKRYLRLTITPANNASSATFAILSIMQPRLRGTA